MKRPDEEFAVLLDGINGIEAGMVRSLLEAEGIPSMKHGPDFNVGEFGQAAHDMLRGTTLLVPHDALERAQELLLESGWSGRLGAAPGLETPGHLRMTLVKLAGVCALVTVVIFLMIGLGLTYLDYLAVVTGALVLTVIADRMGAFRPCAS